MNFEYGKPLRPAQLGEDSLARIAGALSEAYVDLYGERPTDARASLTGNMLAYVFEGGLSVPDEWLLKIDRPERLREFREQFFEVVSERLVAVVADLTGIPVTYSFFGFDPQTRTTHAIFVLDLGGLDESEEHRAVLNWGEQVRRNARRLRAQHVATREAHHGLREEVRLRREELRRAGGEDEEPGSGSDDR